MTSLTTKNQEPRTKNGPPVSAEQFRARWLDHFNYHALLAGLAIMATEDLGQPWGIEFRQRAAAAQGYLLRNVAPTAPQLPDAIYARFLTFPWELVAARPEVLNPVKVETPAQTETYKRRQQNLMVSKAIIANAVGGLESGGVSQKLETPKAPRQVSRGPAPLGLPGPVLGQAGPSGAQQGRAGTETELPEYTDLHQFTCIRCRRDSTGPHCTAFDQVAKGAMCVDCSIEHSQTRPGTK